MTNPQPMSADDLQQLFDNDPELQAQIKAQAEEYGYYVANQRVYAGNALAYAPGHPVPVSNVAQHGYWFNGQVDLVEGKEHPPEMRALIDEREARLEGEAMDRRTAASLGVVDDAVPGEGI